MIVKVDRLTKRISQHKCTGKDIVIVRSKQLTNREETLILNLSRFLSFWKSILSH